MQTVNSFARAITKARVPKAIAQIGLALTHCVGELVGTDFSAPVDVFQERCRFYVGQILANLVLLGGQSDISLHDVAREGLPSAVRYRDIALEFLFYQQQVINFAPPQTRTTYLLWLCTGAGEITYRVYEFTILGISDESRNEARVQLFNSMVRFLQVLALICGAVGLDLSAIAQQEVERQGQKVS
jgi:hypothetical protein